MQDVRKAIRNHTEHLSSLVARKHEQRAGGADPSVQMVCDLLESDDSRCMLQKKLGEIVKVGVQSKGEVLGVEAFKYVRERLASSVAKDGTVAGRDFNEAVSQWCRTKAEKAQKEAETTETMSLQKVLDMIGKKQLKENPDLKDELTELAAKGDGNITVAQLNQVMDKAKQDAELQHEMVGRAVRMHDMTALRSKVMDHVQQDQEDLEKISQELEDISQPQHGIVETEFVTTERGEMLTLKTKHAVCTHCASRVDEPEMGCRAEGAAIMVCPGCKKEVVTGADCGEWVEHEGQCEDLQQLRAAAEKMSYVDRAVDLLKEDQDGPVYIDLRCVVEDDIELLTHADADVFRALLDFQHSAHREIYCDEQKHQLNPASRYLDHFSGEDEMWSVWAQALSIVAVQEALSGPHGQEFQRILNHWCEADRSGLAFWERRISLGSSEATDWNDYNNQKLASKVVPDYEQSLSDLVQHECSKEDLKDAKDRGDDEECEWLNHRKAALEERRVELRQKREADFVATQEENKVIIENKNNLYDSYSITHRRSRNIKCVHYSLLCKTN